MPSFSSTREREVLTVFTLSPRPLAMSDTVWPEPTIRSTWYSRSDNASCGVVIAFAAHRRRASPASSPCILDRGDELLRRTVLGEIPRGPGAERAAGELRGGMHAQHERRHGRM